MATLSIFYLDFPSTAADLSALSGAFSGTILGMSCNFSACPNSQVQLTLDGISQGTFANTDIYGNVINGIMSFTYQMLSVGYLYITMANGNMYIQYEITGYGYHLDLLATNYQNRTYSLTAYLNNNNNNNNTNNTGNNQNNQIGLVNADKVEFLNLLAPKFTGTIVGSWTGYLVGSNCSCPGNKYYAAFVADGGFVLSERYSNNLKNVGPDGTYTGSYTTDTSATPNTIKLYVDIFDDFAYSIFRLNNNTANATLELVITQPGTTNGVYPTQFTSTQNQQYFIFYPANNNTSSHNIGSSTHVSGASTLFVSIILMVVMVVINIFAINH